MIFLGFNWIKIKNVYNFRSLIQNRNIRILPKKNLKTDWTIFKINQI